MVNAEVAEEEVFETNLTEIKTIEAIVRGTTLSKINQMLTGEDTATLLGKLQQLGLLRITYNSEHDTEPLIQLTDKGKQLVITLLFSS